MLKNVIIAAAMLMFYSLHGQNVEGWIFDGEYQNEKQPLAGANVYWVNQNTGTTTNQNGYFALKTVDNSKALVISFVGYRNDTLKILNNRAVQHKLMPGKTLSEITVQERVRATTISKINPVY